jgi:hypothetical protein
MSASDYLVLTAHRDGSYLRTKLSSKVTLAKFNRLS